MLPAVRVTSVNGIGRRFEHDDVAGVADEQRHAAELLGPAEERADIAPQPDPGVDEAFEVVCIPKSQNVRAHHAFLDRDVHEQRVNLGIRRTPGALDDAGDFHVVAVVAAAQHRAERDGLGLRQRPGPSRRTIFGSRFGAKPPRTVRPSISTRSPRRSSRQAPRGGGIGRAAHELPELAVVDDHADVRLLVDVRDDAPDPHRVAAGALVLRERGSRRWW